MTCSTNLYTSHTNGYFQPRLLSWTPGLYTQGLFDISSLMSNRHLEINISKSKPQNFPPSIVISIDANFIPEVSQAKLWSHTWFPSLPLIPSLIISLSLHLSPSLSICWSTCSWIQLSCSKMSSAHGEAWCRCPSWQSQPQSQMMANINHTCVCEHASEMISAPATTWLKQRQKPWVGTA